MNAALDIKVTRKIRPNNLFSERLSEYYCKKHSNQNYGVLVQKYLPIKNSCCMTFYAKFRKEIDSSEKIDSTMKED